MLAHLRGFLRRQRARLVQDAVGTRPPCRCRAAAPGSRADRSVRASDSRETRDGSRAAPRAAGCTAASAVNDGRSRRPWLPSATAAPAPSDAAPRSSRGWRRARVRRSTVNLASVMTASVAITAIVGASGETNRPRRATAAMRRPTRDPHQRDRGQQPRGDARAGHDRRHQRCPRTSAISGVDQRPVRRPVDEVPLQQVVDDRRLHFHADELRVERRGHHLAGAERGRADEDDLVRAARRRRRCRPARRRPRDTESVRFLPRYASSRLLLPSSGTVRSPIVSVDALTLDTCRAGCPAPVAAVTAASARLG